MTRVIGTLFILTLIVFGIYTYVKNFIIGQISGKFVSITFDRVNLSFPNPTLNLSVVFDIINNSNYNFKVKNLKVTIYDNANKKLLSKSEVQQIVPINAGINTVNVVLPDVHFMSNLNNYIGNNVDLFVVVEFRVLGIPIIIEEILKL
jgi:hypothetical protein